MDVSDEQLARWLFEFKLHGYIRLPGSVPGPLVEEMRAQYQEIYQVERVWAGQGKPGFVRGPGRHLTDLAVWLEKMGGPLGDERVRRHPAIAALADRILGRWRYGKTLVETVAEGSEYMHWHADSHHEDRPAPDRPPRTIRLTLQVPLVAVTETNGPTEVIPGSHRMHFTEGHQMIDALPRVHAAPWLAAPGDAFLRDGDLIHRGTPNRTDVPRPLYTQIYKVVNEG